MSSANVVTGSQNSQYSYTFLNNSLTILDEAEICISNFVIPYSWFNVTTAYNNRSFSFTFPTPSSSGVTFNFSLAEGFYLVNDITAALQQFCILNGLYLINPQGLYVYYLTLLYNPTTYGCQVICSLVPTSLPTGWTQPSNWVGYNATSYTPTLTITTNNFGKIIGFAASTYPLTPSTTAQSFLNTFTPLGSNINALVVRCSLVNNPCGMPSDILDTIPITSTFGSNINFSPPALKWIRLQAGTYQKIVISLVDQNLNAVNILDPNVSISILIINKGMEMTEGLGTKGSLKQEEGIVTKVEPLPQLTFR